MSILSTFSKSELAEMNREIAEYETHIQRDLEHKQSLSEQISYLHWKQSCLAEMQSDMDSCYE